MKVQPQKINQSARKSLCQVPVDDLRRQDLRQDDQKVRGIGPTRANPLLSRNLTFPQPKITCGFGQGHGVRCPHCDVFPALSILNLTRSMSARVIQAFLPSLRKRLPTPSSSS